MDKDSKFSRKLVIGCISAWVVYFAIYVVFKFLNPTGTWDGTFTTCWFAAWGGELLMLASIKVSKIKNKYEREE